MNKDYIRTIVSLSLVEDMGKGDITTNSLVPESHKATAQIIAKAPGILCGVDFAREAFAQLDSNVRIQVRIKDGQKLKRGTVIATLSGRTQALLTGERVALNFLSMLSGVATKTRAFVDAAKPYKVDILDTRKTTPLLREAERYAVRCGGGVNHRFDLSTMAMIKDNHREFAEGQMDFVQMVECIRKFSRKPVELEVDNLAQFDQAMASKVNIILLDNMTPAQIKEAVRLRDKINSKVLLEASGGIELKNVRLYAATGVDRISIGGLTHSRQALDISLEFLKDTR